MKVDVVRDLKRELAELQPAIRELERLPEYEAAVQAALQAEDDYRNSAERPTGSGRPDEKTIDLNGETNRARDALARVRDAGNDAARRANQINALLGAGDTIVEIKKRAAGLRDSIKAARRKAEKAAALTEEIRGEIAALEAERTAAIDRGADDRLEGRADTASKVITRVDSELPIRRAALSGAERAQATATADAERLPRELAELDGRLRAAMHSRGELEWMSAQADPALMRAAARYLAAMAINFRGRDVLELRPRRELLDEAVAELNSEIDQIARQ